MIALDTNLLVYAHREDSPWHAGADAAVRRLAEGREPWAIPWPCVHEFLGVVTRPGVYDPPTPLDMALDAVERWLSAPAVALLAELDGYWAEFRALASRARVAGARVHDARIAALCRQHGVRELWTADRDFSRFPQISCRNPLL